MDNLIQREEAKRACHLDPRERWRQIMDAIAWAESQQDPPRNSPRRCLEKQTLLNAAMSRRRNPPDLQGSVSAQPGRSAEESHD